MAAYVAVLESTPGDLAPPSPMLNPTALGSQVPQRHIRAITIQMDVTSNIHTHVEDTHLPGVRALFDMVLSELAGEASKFTSVAEGLIAADAP